MNRAAIERTKEPPGPIGGGAVRQGGAEKRERLAVRNSRESDRVGSKGACGGVHKQVQRSRSGHRRPERAGQARAETAAPRCRSAACLRDRWSFRSAEQMGTFCSLSSGHGSSLHPCPSLLKARTKYTHAELSSPSRWNPGETPPPGMSIAPPPGSMTGCHSGCVE